MTGIADEVRFPLGNDPEVAVAKMRSMSQGRLDEVYGLAEAGPIPAGDSDGTAVFFPAKTLDPAIQRFAAMIWQGKVFDSDEPFLMNKVLGFKAIKAQVYRGASLLDDGESIIIDYSKTSLLAHNIRDEIRIVAPRVYLGRAYLRTWLADFMVVNFILDFNDR